MTDTKDSKYKNGLHRDEQGNVVAVDRIDPGALSHIHVPPIDRSPTAEMPPPIPPSVKMPQSTQELGPMVTVGDFRAVGPETLLRLLSQAHVDYFASDFRGVAGDFVKLRYHLGSHGEPWELHSDSFALDVDSWTPMKEQLTAHIRDRLGDLSPQELANIAVRMVYFHDARVHAPENAPTSAIRHPLDFGCWLRLTVGEFADFVVRGVLPDEVRIGFDATYHALAEQTSEAFRYVKHWRFFAEVLHALSRSLGRPLDKQDPLLAILLAHTQDDLADMVLGLGMHDRRDYESTARIYRPRVETVFSAKRLTVTLSDPQGIMRLYAMDQRTADYHRTIEGNRVTLERRYLQ